PGLVRRASAWRDGRRGARAPNLASEAPATGAERLRTGNAEGDLGVEDVEVPRRMSRRWCAVRRGEVLTVDLHRPPLGAVRGGELLEHCRVRHAPRATLDHQVETGERHRHR